MSKDISANQFEQLGLPDSLLKAVRDVGYETPSPIQSQTIPPLMEGRDVLGHAPTGTGKTGAFALPLLANIDVKNKAVQIMVLTPTRELTIQVAEAFQKYAAHIKGFHVLPIYGGQAYAGQISQLRRGVQTVVGTPGRVMDHMRKGTLNLEGLQALVLDEADEMLRMGFIDDVEWILEQTPEQRQIALFSATMPKEVERIARKHLNEPVEISIKAKAATAATIRQRYWPVSHTHKLDALTRILEVEHFEALIIFVRTKIATTELAEKLEARGHAAAAINGDMPQKQREQTITRLKKGTLDILVATDVAARGLDVDRISHVVNYDIPYDTEAYIHRIGRTGRAGRTGDAILFVAPREKRMLDAIEKATRQKIDLLELPTTEMVNDKRIADFTQSITDTIAAGELSFYQQMFESYQQEHDVAPLEIAAALAKLMVGEKGLLLDEAKSKTVKPANLEDMPGKRGRRERTREDRGDRKTRGNKRESKAQAVPPEGLERYRIEVGHDHGVAPGNIVGAIANEAGLDADHIGHIDIYSTHSTVDLPEGMPRDVFRALKKVWVCQRQLNITHDAGDLAPPAKKPQQRGQAKEREQRKPRKRPGRKANSGKSSGDVKGAAKKRVATSANSPKKRKAKK
jgi:ATP-dependent RNA helicase DeaD